MSSKNSRQFNWGLFFYLFFVDKETKRVIIVSITTLIRSISC
ncbi:hypothetical protein HMPREF0495_00540 [Levilactobacillus brevis ATCC 14869 = DSM 20054]|uniref:Uncharacterized protein n=1 Tax=Levilactobacillus brevis ATCC 14869 = DSM 20054 TaxID=649758 RepID=U2QU98_LEVBR|nr:hypothetical protein HMPREF0495_00540 [Levilactobacillus brevis ATCC 14869 = DSM 20054]